MRKPFSLAAVLRLLVALTVVVGSAVLLSSTDEPAFTQNDKAFYADPSLVNFVRPGLVVKIVSASVATDGTITARFTLTDPKGLPLDRDGITTPGAISTSLVAAYIPKDKTQYVSYTTRSSVGANGNGVTVIQAGADSGGTYTKNADGDYTYKFKTKAVNADRTVTHTIGLYANRNLTEFDLDMNANRADTVFSFVPAGGAVTVTRDIIRTATCNKCHDPLAAHGTGGRRSMEVCVLCHTPQTVNPATGVTADMPVMIHKIHMGSSLPSVAAGKPYQWITSHGTSDFSTVAFPAGANNCLVCHDQNSPAAQKTNVFKPTRAACGACHDDVNFATGEKHANLPQISDNQCQTCHQPQGEMDFDISILGAHVTPTKARALPGTVVAVTSVDGAAPGKAPVVTFTVKDKTGAAIDASKMNALRLVVAGSTSDYTTYKSIDVRKATGSAGTYKWTLDPLAADAKGSMSIGIEGYRNITLYPGTKVEQTVRDAAINKVMHYSVDGSPVQPRRQVVSIDKCNSCHSFLSPHGGNRNQIEQCVLCHNATETDAIYRKPTDGPANTMDFKHLIHKLHRGESMDSASYNIVGYQGSKTDFKEVRFPGDLRNCSECHVNGSENLPTAATAQIKSDAAGYLNPMGPATSACTGCHDSIATASHALSNTTAQLGEACAACHSTNREFGVAKVHAR